MAVAMAARRRDEFWGVLSRERSAHKTNATHMNIITITITTMP
jgi:hypothetical protein